MKLNADAISSPQQSTLVPLQFDRTGANYVAGIIGLFQESLGKAGLKKLQHVRSALVGGIGIVNLYEVDFEDVRSLEQLRLQDLHSVILRDVSEEVMGRLKVFLGDINEQLVYLLEYPDGYLLSFNQELLSFRMKWPS